MPTIEEKAQKTYQALKRISQYESPEKLRRDAERDYGLEYEEVLEMAYENVLHEAKSAIKGMRLPQRKGQVV